MPKKRDLEQEYRYQLSKRSGWRADQLPGAADDGDRDAITECARKSAVLVEQLKFPAEFEALQEWLVSALWSIHTGHGGVSPDEAFCWKRPRHRPREFRSLRKQALIGRAVAELLRTQPALTIEAAAEQVSRSYSGIRELWVTTEMAIEYYKGLAERPAEPKGTALRQEQSRRKGKKLRPSSP